MSENSDFKNGEKDFKKITASQVMEADVKCFTTEAHWDDIGEILTLGDFGSVPIVDGDNTLVGLVSEHDLLTALVEGKDPRTTTAGDIMTKEVIAVTEDAKVEDIIKILLKDQLIRVPVVKKGKLVGIVARRDVVFGYLRAVGKPPR